MVAPLEAAQLFTGMDPEMCTMPPGGTDEGETLIEALLAYAGAATSMAVAEPATTRAMRNRLIDSSLSRPHRGPSGPYNAAGCWGLVGGSAVGRGAWRGPGRPARGPGRDNPTRRAERR